MNLDLHLLQVFLAVYETRNVGAAANHLKMSQPGLSTALGRLRIALDDPLFVRTHRGMEPTARAHALWKPISDIVNTVTREVLTAPTFDPATSEREFKIALTDIGEGIYLPFALRSFQQHGPGLSLRSMYLPPKQLDEAMSSGEIDLALGYFPDIKGNQFFQRRIGLHSFVCLVRDDHPRIGANLSMEDFTSLGHVVVEAPGRSQEQFEEFMKAQKIPRNIVLRTPHFMSVPIIVAGTDAIAVVPQALGDFFSGLPGIRLIDLPFVPPTFQVNMYWHRSVQLDPANKWIRGIMTEQFPVIEQRAYHRSGKRETP